MNRLKQTISKLLSHAGIRVSLIKKRGKETLGHYVDVRFPPLYKKYCDESMVAWQGMHDAFDAAAYITESNIEGDVVECGVWRGGVSGLMKDVVYANEGSSERKFWLFDTFEGMTAPSKSDFKSGEDQEQTLNTHKQSLRADGTSDWCRGDLPDVKKTISKSSGGLDNVKFIKGKVENTLRLNNVPSKIALLRLDTDFYESTKVELEVLLPKLATGGILIIDDYGAWAGARKAFNEMKEGKGLEGFAVFRNHIDGALIAIKTS